MILSWGKDFTNKELNKTDFIFKEDTSLTGFIYTNDISTENYNLKNLSDKEITITSYQVIGSGDSEVLGIAIPLSTPVILSPGSGAIMPYPCAPDNSFAINLITDEDKYIPVTIKTNSQNNSCSTNAAPNLVCLGVQENGTGDSNSDPFVICSVSDLNNIRYPNLDKYYILGKNLDLGVAPYNDGNGWEPIGVCVDINCTLYGDYNTTFYGSFDGNGHKISNLYINRPATSTIGLFGYTAPNSVIQNLILENPNVTGSNAVGALLGINRGTAQNCNLDNVRATGNMYVGGFIGVNYGTISSCYSKGNVSASARFGGFVGNNSTGGTITKSYSEGTVTGGDKVGGFVGYCLTGTVSLNYSKSAVYGTDDAGGFVGHGGCTISNSYALGNVTRLSGTSSSLGGFVGFNIGGITKSYSTGRVIYANAENPINSGFCYGFGSSLYSFWDMNTSLQSSSATGVGKTTSEMKTQSTFTDVNWDFSTIWAIQEGITYPYLIDNVQDPLPQ